MKPTRQLAAQLRPLVEIAPARPAIAAGVRAALATTAPIVAGRLLGMSGLSWAGLAGYSVALADRGGSYRTRAEAMGALTLSAALSVVVASAVGEHGRLAVPLMLLWATACGLARAYGPAAGSVGSATAIIFAVALAAPTPVGAALARGPFVIVGGVWAMLLALVLWPLRPYRPSRLAAAECYRALAAFALDVARHVERGATHTEWNALIVRHTTALHERIEAARATVATSRRGRPGESPRGERLLVLVEGADQMFGDLVALADVLDAAPPHPETARTRIAIARAMAAWATSAEETAAAIEREERALAPTVAWSAEPARAAIASLGEDDAARPHLEQGVALVERLRDLGGLASEMAAGLPDDRDDGTPEERTLALAPPRTASRPSPAMTLLTQLDPGSLVLRHALRLGITAAAAVAITTRFGLAKGYWVTVTAIIILEPYAGLTQRKALQRVGGTAVGAMLSAGLAALVHDPWGVLALIFVLAAVSVAVLPLNYGVFSVFLTPTFVLLAELNAGDWHLASLRIENTALGAVLAFLATRLLWPLAERERFPELMAAVLRSDVTYLRRVVATLTGGARSDGLADARRRVGLALTNAEASFQRVVAESPAGAEQLESVMTMLVYARRFEAAVTALAAIPPSGDPAAREAELRHFETIASHVLADIADAVERGRAPTRIAHVDLDATARADGPTPTPRVPAAEEALGVRIGRALRPLRVLHAAATRLAGEEAHTGTYRALGWPEGWRESR